MTIRDKTIVLFAGKKDCCGCWACQAICPKDAIDMREDEEGFLYPHIDEAKCIRCGRCLSVCPIGHKQNERCS